MVSLAWVGRGSQAMLISASLGHAGPELCESICEFLGIEVPK